MRLCFSFLLISRMPFYNESQLQSTLSATCAEVIGILKCVMLILVPPVSMQLGRTSE